jgi:hypothetical protein
MNNYKHGDGANFEVMSYKFIIDRIYTKIIRSSFPYTKKNDDR